MKYKVTLELEVHTSKIIPRHVVSNIVINRLFADIPELFDDIHGLMIKWTDIRTRHSNEEEVITTHEYISEEDY